MCLYLSLSALHVSDSLVHHQERRFGAVYRNWYKPVRLAVARRTGETWRALNDKYRHIIIICASSWSTYIHILFLYCTVFMQHVSAQQKAIFRQTRH